jgi:predicted nucleic acid-binding protein
VLTRLRGPGLVQTPLLASARQLLLDTNALIYFLTGLEPYVEVLVPLFRRVQQGEASILVSVITEAELLVRPEREGNAAAVQRIGDLLSEDGVYVVNMDRRIARRAAALRGQRRLGLADAIIVATAIETECDAIVGNDHDWTNRINEIPFVQLDAIVSAK